MKAVFLLLLVFLPCLVQAQKKISVSKQKRDFEVLKTTLLENTGNPYLHTDSLRFVEKCREIDAYLDVARTRRELFVCFSEFVSLVKCGHTSIIPTPGLFLEYCGARSFFTKEVIFKNDELILLKNIPKTSIKRGFRVIEIDRQPIREIKQRLFHLLWADGDNITFKQKILEFNFPFYYYMAYGPKDNYQVRYVNELQDTMQATLPAIEPMEISYRFGSKAWKAKPYGNFKSYKKDNYAVFKIQSFKKAGGRAYRDFLEGNFKKINKNKITNLVIDLRGNLGGIVQTELISHFADSTFQLGYQRCNDSVRPHYFRYFKHRFSLPRFRYFLTRIRVRQSNKRGEDPKYVFYTKKSSYYGLTQFKGQVYVLVDGFSFSASAHLSAILKEKFNAIIIGEEVGGGMAGGNTGQLVLKLPKTNFKVGINPVYFNNGVELTSCSTSLCPDYEIKEKVILTGKKRDLHLEKALELIKSKKVQK